MKTHQIIFCIFSAALVFMQAAFLAGCSEVETPKWKDIYIDFIINEEKSNLYMNENLVNFSLVKVDNDEIPELIYFEDNRLTQIIWIKNGEIERKGIGNDCFLYMEKENLFYGFYSKGGFIRDAVYQFDDEKNISMIFEGTGKITDSGTIDYTVENKKLTTEDYEAKLGEAFDKNTAASPVKYTGADSIVQAIKDY